jgi:hypothetical protein
MPKDTTSEDRQSSKEPFALVRSIAASLNGAQGSFLVDSLKSPLSAFALSLGVFFSAAALSASFVASSRARTKAERDLPSGTHWRAASRALRALGAASAATAALACGACGAAAVIGGIHTPKDVREAFGRHTRAGFDVVRRGEKGRGGAT